MMWGEAQYGAGLLPPRSPLPAAAAEPADAPPSAVAGERSPDGKDAVKAVDAPVYRTDEFRMK